MVDWNKVQKDVGFPEELIPLFEEHDKWGTAEFYLTEGKYRACVRYNISKSGSIANIIDLFCADKRYSIKAMRWFGAEGKRKFPLLKYIRFERGTKYPDRDIVIYKIERLMR